MSTPDVIKNLQKKEAEIKRKRDEFFKAAQKICQLKASLKDMELQTVRHEKDIENLWKSCINVEVEINILKKQNDKLKHEIQNKRENLKKESTTFDSIYETMWANSKSVCNEINHHIKKSCANTAATKGHCAGKVDSREEKNIIREAENEVLQMFKKYQEDKIEVINKLI